MVCLIVFHGICWPQHPPWTVVNKLQICVASNLRRWFAHPDVALTYRHRQLCKQLICAQLERIEFWLSALSGDTRVCCMASLRRRAQSRVGKTKKWGWNEVICLAAPEGANSSLAVPADAEVITLAAFHRDACLPRQISEHLLIIYTCNGVGVFSQSFCSLVLLLYCSKWVEILLNYM